MSCIDNLPSANADYEMEEGEIIDDLDDLSDISSEEEFLLRQRLEVLENYNNVLERKKAKTSLCDSGREKNEDALSHDLSDISDKEDSYPLISVDSKLFKNQYLNTYHKQKRNKEVAHKDHKKKPHRTKKKTLPKIRISESSEESEDEYRTKRRKLANAVSVTKIKNDTSSLKDRLEKMLCGSSNYEPMKIENGEKTAIDISKAWDWSLNSYNNSDNNELSSKNNSDHQIYVETLESQVSELIDLCQEDARTLNNDISEQDCVDSALAEKKEMEDNKDINRDSDEDLELLRQHALKTKVSRPKIAETNLDMKMTEIKNTNLSEDEDSDTAELRLICLKSALLKKAIEVKQKQKLRKRLSQSFQDDFELEDRKLQCDADNNTDIESVDMDMGSDCDEKFKELSNNYGIIEESKQNTIEEHCILNNTKQPKDDDIDEDEDLLRAKLLTSLSKNFPNLIHPNIITQTIADVKKTDQKTSGVKTQTAKTAPEEKPFIIKLGESDSEGEHESTKNLTKMHQKLSEQVDFQQKLDLFLKSTRMEVEKKTLPDVVQDPLEQPKPAPKFVAKAVKNLPKSEQIEYRNLVKRMAELEKVKQARQSSMTLNKIPSQAKDTLKPRNVSIETAQNGTNDNLENLIATSRKKIAEESSKMLKLKEEATKLTQKYKIVQTELRNISTAITFNNKQQKAVQNRLSNIRLQHQMLLKRSSSLKHSKVNMPLVNRNNGKTMTGKLQKENNPVKDEYKNPQLLKSVKVSVHNDLKDDNAANARLSVQVDVGSNKKVVKIPKSSIRERTVDLNIEKVSDIKDQEKNETTHPEVEKGGGATENRTMMDANSSDIGKMNEADDYKSPLEALHRGTWEEDPNSFLCPFEVAGTCKDPDCKYLHPKVPSAQ